MHFFNSIHQFSRLSLKVLWVRINGYDSNVQPLPNILIDQYEVLDPRIAYQITSMLEGVVIRGTAKKLKELKIPLAGNTGTTNDNKDAWFIGFTPQLTIGIWVGMDDPSMVLGDKQYGSSAALPIFAKAIQSIYKKGHYFGWHTDQGTNYLKHKSKHINGKERKLSLT